MYESLHNHTKASDGPFSYLELLSEAERNNLGVMALTDHDVVVSPNDLEVLRAYQGPVKWLSGVEISSGLPSEQGGGPAQMFHILGLFTDPTNVALIEHCRKAVAARTDRMTRMVANLRRIGFDITVDDCLREAGGEEVGVGRKHITRALEKSPFFPKVMDRLRKQMADEALEDPEVAMMYLRLQDSPQSDHPYQLFLRNDAYLDDIYVDYSYWTDMDTSVRLIRDAGGIAILAHWTTIAKEVPLDLLERILANGRLDGVELRSSFDDETQDRDEAALREIADRTGAAVTYGADAHSGYALQAYAQRTKVVERSVGNTQALIERFKPDLTYSNLS